MAKRDHARAKSLEPSRGVVASAEKSIISIRMPVEVLRFVEDESRARGAALGLKGSDLDNAINVTAQIQYLVFRRYEAATKNGPGFDGEGTQSEKASRR